MLLENEVLVFAIVLKVVVIMQMNNWQLIFFFCLFVIGIFLQEGLIDGRYM